MNCRKHYAIRIRNVDTKQKTTEQDACQYWRRSARKSRRERIRNTVVREMMEVEKKTS
jgi:hypothetical protein